jgi:hypothetical protein
MELQRRAGRSKGIPGIGIPYSKQWYHHQKSKNTGGLPGIPFGFVYPSQTRHLRIDERATGNEKITKEA